MRESADQDQGGEGNAQRQALGTKLSRRKLLLKIVATVIFVTALGAGSFFIFLSRGPIDLSWLAPEIVASLSDLSGGKYAYKLAGASIVNSEHGPTISVDGLVVQSEGHSIIAAPRAQLSLNYAALLMGKVVPRRLEVLDLDLNLVVLADGAVAVSAGAEQLETKALNVPAFDVNSIKSPNDVALLKIIAGALQGLMDLATDPASVVGSLDRVGVLHGRLSIDDRTHDRKFNYSDVSLSLDKGKSGMLFSLGATGPSGRWTADAFATGSPGNQREFRATIRDLSIDEISLVGGFRVSGFDTDAPLSVDMNFTLAPNNSLLHAGGRLEIGKGYFRLDEPDHEPVMIQHIELGLHWDNNQKKLQLSPIDFKAGGFDMAMSGFAQPPPETSGEKVLGDDSWRISLNLSQPSKVYPERASEEVVEVNEGGLDARLNYGQGRILFDKFAFSGPDIHASLTGYLDFKEKFRIVYHLDADNTRIKTIARLWPTHVTPPVRVWFVEHVTSGILKHARLSGDFDAAAITAMRYERPPPDDSVQADGEIIDGVVENVIPGLAPITAINGVLHVTGRTASFKARSGTFETASGRRLSLSEGQFAIADNAIKPPPATLDIRLNGDVEAVADILNVPTIKEYASLPVEASNLKGRLDGKFHLDFEVGDLARDENTKFSVDATTTDLSVEHLIGKEKLESAALHVVANPNGLRVDGSGKIYGAPIMLDLQRAFGDKGVAQAQVNFTFDDASRQRAGFAIEGLTGSIAASVKTPLPIEELNTDIELDFTRAAFENPIPGLVKTVGTPGKASFKLVRRGENILIDQINFESGASVAQGVIELSKEGVLQSGKLSPLRLSQGDDMKIDILKNGDVTKFIIRGANVDARPMLGTIIRAGALHQRPTNPPNAKTNTSDKKNTSHKASVSFGDFDVDFKSPIVTGHNKQILSNVELKLESRGGAPRSLAFGGSFGQEKIAATISRNQNNLPQLEIATHEAGSLLSFLDLYRKMESGEISATIQIGQDRADGSLKIHDFYVKGEPMMRQLMAQGGSSRIDERGNARFDPESVEVGQLLADFSWNAGRLSIQEGVLSGPAIGLTFDGFFDMAHDRLDIAGAYVPAYALNSLLSNIPVLGVLISGGQHEGIFALNYRLTGAISSPVITVNPLSALAPGLMRKILGVIDGTAHMPGVQ